MSTDKRIRGRKLQTRRARWFARFPLCVRCDQEGKTTLAQELDHIIPLDSGGTDDPGNWQGLCKPCHLRKSLSEGSLSRGAATYPDWLKPAACPLTIVFGPPGSGKSRYVDEHRCSTDQVIDLDHIKAEISGLPLYLATVETLPLALRERNRRLGELCRQAEPCWFIVSGAGQTRRDWWRAMLKPTAMVVLSESYAVCCMRIKADKRRPESIKQLHMQAAADWWAAERAKPIKRAQERIGADGEPVGGYV